MDLYPFRYLNPIALVPKGHVLPADSCAGGADDYELVQCLVGIGVIFRPIPLRPLMQRKQYQMRWWKCESLPIFIPQQFRHRHPKRVGQLNQRSDGRIAAPPLKIRYIASLDRGTLGEVLLGPVPGGTEVLDLSREPMENRGFG